LKSTEERTGKAAISNVKVRNVKTEKKPILCDARYWPSV
jgi:hypothetical protein